MLSKILIKNYILIDELELDLAEGLNIITGETGAGKSILINAIDIAFGAKAGKEVIKGDAEKAVIELTLCNKNRIYQNCLMKMVLITADARLFFQERLPKPVLVQELTGVWLIRNLCGISANCLSMYIHSTRLTHSYSRNTI